MNKNMLRESKIIDACSEKYGAELNALRAHRDSGGLALGYVCHMFPSAVAAGLGLWPLRVLCGSSAEAETSGERFVRPDVCPLVKSLLGNASERKSLYADIDIWAGLYTCDQMKRGLHCLTKEIGWEVHPIQLPATRTPEASAYFAGHVGRAIADISARHGLSFDPEKALDWNNELIRAGNVLAEAARVGRVSPRELHAMFHLYLIARPHGLADFFGGLIESSSYAAKKTVVVTGSPLTIEDTLLLEIMEERGYSVIPLNCTGLNAVEGFSINPRGKDVVAALAEASFNLPPCSRSRPNNMVYDRIGRVLSETGASGLIVKSLKFCDQWYTERERMRKTFDVPVFVFDSDYAAGGRERLAGRIEAYLEMLE